MLPWLEPDTTTEHDAFATLMPIWSEHLFHLSLRFSARRFLWWRAGRDQPLSRGMATASKYIIRTRNPLRCLLFLDLI